MQLLALCVALALCVSSFAASAMSIMNVKYSVLQTIDQSASAIEDQAEQDSMPPCHGAAKNATQADQSSSKKTNHLCNHCVMCSMIGAMIFANPPETKLELPAAITAAALITSYSSIVLDLPSRPPAFAPA